MIAKKRKGETSIGDKYKTSPNRSQI